jgi:branched-chain amino acid transport system permease protein
VTDLILFNVTNGLIIGAFYVLMALGLSLILNLSGVINFAHGGFLALAVTSPTPSPRTWASGPRC